MPSNVTDEICPACGKNLRFKPPCCSDKNAYLVCPCGYKKVRDEVTPVDHSGGSHDATGLQG